jgi:hypothetical protein
LRGETGRGRSGRNARPIQRRLAVFAEKPSDVAWFTGAVEAGG